MARSKKTKSKKEVNDPKLEKKPYELIEDLQVGDKLLKKGQDILLTEEGKKYLKSINKIR